MSFFKLCHRYLRLFSFGLLIISDRLRRLLKGIIKESCWICSYKLSEFCNINKFLDLVNFEEDLKM